jgi:hypothetical protein
MSLTFSDNSKLLCYRELKSLYGLKRGEHGGEAIKGQKGFQPIDSSTERPVMSDAEIAKEVGFFYYEYVAVH